LSEARSLDDLRYEELVELLEQLTRKMASPEVGIEEAVSLFEEAGEVHAAASRRLVEVTERLERLAARLAPPEKPPEKGTG
jgi:exodeoxyribonuclease VII small subunit